MSESNGSKDGLLAKLHVAQKAAEGVAKQGTNTQQHYHYAKAEDVIKAAQGYLQDAGLVAFMEFSAPEPREVESNAGTAGVLVSIAATLVIGDPESRVNLPGDVGNALRVRGFGSGIDYPGDKAIYKAMTGAAKYAYASALGIPFTDDPEATDAGERKPRGGGGEASPAQKRLTTTLFNRANVNRDFQREIVHAVAGDPPTKAGLSKLLDVLADDDKGELADRAAQVIEMSGVTPPSDVPADTSDLPPEDDGGTTLEARAEPVDHHKA